MIRRDAFRTGLAVSILAFALGFSVGRAEVPGAGPVKGEKTVLENDKVRVVEFVLEPGVAMGMHSHPRDRVEINLEGGRVRVTTEEGKTQEVDEKTG
jgi:quercetin dioxygenase-like cupin family protein